MAKNGFLALLLLLATNVVAAKFPFPALPDKAIPPNVIWIIANDLGIGDLGCYGQKRIETRNLNRMAREGMMFTQCYASSPDNLIARAGILTGRDQRHLDLLPDSPVLIEPGVTTIGQALQPAGYRNGYIGKWLVGQPNSYSQPQRKGFNDWIGELEPQTVTDFYPDFLWRFDPDRKFNGKQPWGYNLGHRKGVYLNEFFLRSMTNYVRIHRPTRWNRFVPFFNVVSFALPNPLDEWKGNTNRFAAMPNDGWYAARKDWPKAERQKAAAISLLDNYLGQLFRVLELHEQVNNTVIFLTSDGGAFERGGTEVEFFDSNGPFRGKRGDLTEGGIRVPMLVRWFGTIRPSTNHMMISQLDLMPTTLEIARAKKAEGLDGISLLPTFFRKEQTNRHQLLVWENTNRFAIRKGNWKAIQGTNSDWELYNLKTDVGEGTNLVETMPMVLRSLTNEVAQWRRDKGVEP
ncbi:MAG: sulfatase-like hydrolase/transferase [Limisphaerales bacterium]